MQRMHILRKASGSSQSLLVRSSAFLVLCQKSRPNNIFIELELDEEGTRISLTIVDTPGFGDQIDNEAR
jgi:septin family protein